MFSITMKVNDGGSGTCEVVVTDDGSEGNASFGFGLAYALNAVSNHVSGGITCVVRQMLEILQESEPPDEPNGLVAAYSAMLKE